MEQYLLLEGCPVDGMAEFFENRLSHNMEDYPYGIVIPVDKPYRWTSADVVRKCKFQLQKHFGTKKLKVGHAGTLDPLATGLLAVCVGKATKISEELQSHEKEYVATIEFGATTASYDLEQPIDQTFPYEHIDEGLLRRILQDFIGEQEQVPPAFSAKIIGGLRAYEYARAGEPIELKTTLIEIRELELLEFRNANSGNIEHNPVPAPLKDLSHVRNIHNYHTSEASDGSRPQAVIRIVCSKGTYVRSFARDLGLALESGAYLTALRRTRSGELHV